MADLQSSAMSLLPAIKLDDGDKLEMLQRLDQFRKWNSLEEKRYCLVCSSLITGRKIEVIGGTRGTGPLRAICPTPRCHSIPMDWILPTNEVLEKISSEPPMSTIRPNPWRRREGALATALRKFAGQFRRVA